MKNLKLWLTTNKTIPHWFALSLLVIAALGLADSAFLAFEHMRGVPPPCGAGSQCEVVTTSSYAQILGIPVAYLGTLYYAFIVVLCVLYFDKKNSAWIRLASLVTPIGLVMSLWFLGVQAFILHAYCYYCLGSAATSTTLAILSAVFWKKDRTVV